jgi:two-component system, OmpR family, phosphate regulon response regulator PhoB
MQTAGASPFKILLVEDEPVIRELVQSMLADDGVEVQAASNGPEGLRLARTSRYDLILLDVMLPELDGITICRLLKSEPATRGMPLYMLTAMAKKADIENALRAGADGYIQKPFKGKELIELVQHLQRTGREAP